MQGNASQMVFERHKLVLNELLKAVQDTSYWIVEMIELGRSNPPRLADLLAGYIAVWHPTLADALIDANLLLGPQTPVIVMAAEKPIPCLGALVGLNIELASIVRNAVVGIEFIPANRAPISAALQRDWQDHGVPNLGNSTTVSDVRAIAIAVCEDIKAAASKLRMEYYRATSPGNAEGDTWLTIADAATASGANPGTISRAANFGKLKSNGKASRERRIDSADLARWILERGKKPPPQESDEAVRRKLGRLSDD